MEKANIKFTIWYIAFFMLLMVVFSAFILYGREGYNVEIIRTQFIFYGFYGVGSLLIILFFYIFENLEPTSYGTSVLFNSPGEMPSPSLDYFKNTWRLILVCFILFCPLALFATFADQTYLGIGDLEQQFTQTDNILFNWLMVVTSENAGAFALCAFGIVWLRRVAKKNNWSKGNFMFLSLLLTLLVFTGYGFINHQLRYSNMETALNTVLQFWFFLGAITWAFASFIPAFIAHGVNNTYVEFAKMIKAGLLSDDQLILYTVVFIVVCAVLLGLTYLKKRNKKEEGMII